MSLAQPENHLAVRNRAEFRAWLSIHYATETECWVNVKRGTPKADDTFWYVDAVEEAMCFGWIDSTYKKLQPDQPAAQRFVPRRPGSAWSELNKARCRRMIRLGQMTAAGKAVLPDMEPTHVTIDPHIKSALKRRPGAWLFFCQCPLLYRQVRIDTIEIKANQPRLFHARLRKFADACRDHRLIGHWNDGGRLHDDD